MQECTWCVCVRAYKRIAPMRSDTNGNKAKKIE